MPKKVCCEGWAAHPSQSNHMTRQPRDASLSRSSLHHRVPPSSIEIRPSPFTFNYAYHTRSHFLFIFHIFHSFTTMVCFISIGFFLRILLTRELGRRQSVRVMIFPTRSSRLMVGISRYVYNGRCIGLFDSFEEGL